MIPRWTLLLSLACVHEACALEATPPAVAPRSVDAPKSQAPSTPSCAPEAARPGTLFGSPFDVHTPPGIYDGYEVYLGCPGKWWDRQAVVIRGTGTKPIVWGQREVEWAFWRLADEAREVACVESIHDRCYAGTCRTDEGGITLQLHDWRDVDVILRRLGAWLRDRSLRGEIILRLEPMPGPGRLIGAPSRS
jgi:hypothetical protein